MRPPRFRIRTLMLAVAVAAGLMGGTIATMRMSRRAEQYRQRAARFATRETVYRNLAEKQAALQREIQVNHDDTPAIEYTNISEHYKYLINYSERELAYLKAMATYGADMKRKYLRAASRPWEAVPPDPPEPDFPPDFRLPPL